MKKLVPELGIGYEYIIPKGSVSEDVLGLLWRGCLNPYSRPMDPGLVLDQIM